MKKVFWFSLPLCVFAVILSGCTPQNQNRVVLYCSVDEVYARPLIQKLELQTGLQIDALFDTEATKTAGLANRIRAESSRPRADVFWSSALLQTLLMSDEKLLEAYDSPSARDLPARFRGRDWAGVGVRARVLTQTDRPNWPQFSATLPQLDNLPQHAQWLGISNPQFGTASDWSTALSQRWGGAKALRVFREMKDGGVRVLPGNGDVARQTAAGLLTLGVTDSDDLLAQMRATKTIRIIPTEKDNVLIPGAVSLLKGAPNSQNARKLFDAIASAQNEANLVKQMPGVFSLRRLDQKANFQSGGVDFSWLQSAPRDDYSQWPATWRQIRDPLNQIFAPK